MKEILIQYYQNYSYPDFLQPNRNCTEEEFEQLGSELKEVFPQWLKEIILEFPIENTHIDYRTVSDGITYSNLYDLVGFSGISEEFFDMHPGFIVAEKGYLCIAEGGNDHIPLFICIDEGENPPVYKIDNDYGDEVEDLLTKGKSVFVEKFSDLFQIDKL